MNTPPSFSHLCVFGSLILARKPNKPAAKLDVHISKGIFLGYGSTDKYVQYIDLNTGWVKLSTHHTFDEAHFSATHCLPGAQTLFQLELHHTPENVDVIPSKLMESALYPPLPTSKMDPPP